jgi:hypothetical protein
MTQSFWIPGKLPALNEVLEAAKGAGGSGARYSKLKATWTEFVWAHAKAARLKPMVGRVRLRFEWREANRRRDPDNVAAAGRKVILDGLVMAGVLGGDGWRHIAGWEDVFVECAKPGVSVTITDATE